MSRLIDADEFRKFLISTKAHGSGYHHTSDILSALDKCPTVDAEPVKHGHWIARRDEDCSPYWQCSNCEREFSENTYYYERCPHCGAIMDEEAEHETD